MSSKFPKPGRDNRHAKLLHPESGKLMTKVEADFLIASRRASQRDAERMARARQADAVLPPVNKAPPPMVDELAKVFPGKWNFYRCKDCGAFFVTFQRDEGVTPAFIGCKEGKKDCPGQMASAFYPDPEKWPTQVPRVAHANWVRPDARAIKMMKKKYPSLYQHVMAGGLVLAATNETTPEWPKLNVLP